MALAARVWAREVLAPRPASRSLGSAVLALVTDPWGGTLGALVGERRAARRILAARSPGADRPE
ncbi:MAG: hypothetical protein AVDCRST_MAG57-1837 [uncultured Blastococcus sp.]|uniref:Uncharacterized protein n=1 Tax=uncultured Blastococcus sp. TaxID=217144 RepID=A0A6J4IC93_9ACTN|nr:MAG: hypothetical protein AVDCRST_MAG57-1837 [uncultured Blastococcus sp.]